MAEGRSERHLWPEGKWHLWKCVDSLSEGLERGEGQAGGEQPNMAPRGLAWGLSAWSWKI